MAKTANAASMHGSRCELCGVRLRSSNKIGVCQRNPECKRERNRRWGRLLYAENRESVNERRRRRHAENPEPTRERQRRWRAENPEYTRLWQAENPEAVKEISRRRRERKRNLEGRYIELHSDVCWICGSSLDPDFHGEHVISLAQMEKLIELPENENLTSGVIPACAPCNRSKHDRDPAEFILKRWRSGLPIRQASTVSCDSCPILALKRKEAA